MLLRIEREAALIGMRPVHFKKVALVAENDLEIGRMKKIRSFMLRRALCSEGPHLV